MTTFLTWNMQRSPVPNESTEAATDAAKVRGKFLAAVAKAFDYVFVQEAPHSLLGAKEFEGVNIYVNKNPDTQNDSNACRNMILTRNALTEVDDDFVSGHEKANRHPVTFFADRGNFKLYLTSFHATSSTANAKKNCESYLDYHKFKNNYIWFIGADFNFDFTKISNCPIVQPNAATQQSGHTLDGFAVLSNFPMSAPSVFTYKPSAAAVGWDCGFKSKETGPFTHPYLGDLFGFLALGQRPSDQPNHHHHQPGAFKLSDHCPVAAITAF